MFKKFSEYLMDESGQTSTEYILLVAVVAIIVFKFKEVAVEELERLTETIFSGASRKISTDLDF